MTLSTTRNCEHCERSFRPTRSNHTHYCSKRCRRASEKARQRARKISPPVALAPARETAQEYLARKQKAIARATAIADALQRFKESENAYDAAAQDESISEDQFEKSGLWEQVEKAEANLFRLVL